MRKFRSRINSNDSFRSPFCSCYDWSVVNLSNRSLAYLLLYRLYVLWCAFRWICTPFLRVDKLRLLNVKSINVMKFCVSICDRTLNCTVVDIDVYYCTNLWNYFRYWLNQNIISHMDSYVVWMDWTVFMFQCSCFYCAEFAKLRQLKYRELFHILRVMFILFVLVKYYCQVLMETVHFWAI